VVKFVLLTSRTLREHAEENFTRYGPEICWPLAWASRYDVGPVTEWRRRDGEPSRILVQVQAGPPIFFVRNEKAARVMSRAASYFGGNMKSFLLTRELCPHGGA